MASLNMPKGFEGQRVYLSQSTKEVDVLGCFGFTFLLSGLVHFEHRLLDLLHMQLWFRLFSSIITYAKHESNEKHESNVPKCSGN